ncbi:MAG: DUF5320 domain-containing protein [Eubacteriales bacterium]|nr:DUF5320 domain-containing protein [Eubacteriales bacterium]
MPRGNGTGPLGRGAGFCAYPKKTRFMNRQGYGCMFWFLGLLTACAYLVYRLATIQDKD